MGKSLKYLERLENTNWSLQISLSYLISMPQSSKKASKSSNVEILIDMTSLRTTLKKTMTLNAGNQKMPNGLDFNKRLNKEIKQEQKELI